MFPFCVQSQKEKSCSINILTHPPRQNVTLSRLKTWPASTGVARHITTLYFDDLDNENPTMAGDFWIDLDRQDLTQAIAETNILLNHLEKLGVDLACCDFFASGGKGFHIRIPAEMMGATPCPELGDIYGNLALRLAHPTLGVDLGIDLALYGKKHLLRCENMRRPDGRLQGAGFGRGNQAR
jgi:hypothetical protein